MPDFFLVAGLFLARTIDRPWRDFLDKKILHFGYFFVLWTLIQGVPKLALSLGADPAAIFQGLAFSMIEPFGTLWFIYLLPIFFLTTRLVRNVPADVVLASAAILQMLQISTDWIVIDEFAGRYVYFFVGYAYAPHIFAFASQARGAPGRVMGALLVWGVTNGLAVRYGLAALPGVSLILGFAGAAAVVAVSALLAQSRALPQLAALGSRSIIVYLAFFLPMAATRVILIRLGLIENVGAISFIVTVAAILVPLTMERLTRGTRLSFLFERPAAFRLKRKPSARKRGVAPSTGASRSQGSKAQLHRDWRLSA